MSNPIRIGLVGLGRAGWGMHIQEIKDKKEKFQVVAVCDILPERVKKSMDHCGCTGYGSIDELIADPNVELVDIATRSCDHYEHAMKALKAGKDVLLEKPMTLNYEQAKELFANANQPGKPRLFIRQNRRFEKVFSLVRDTIQSGVLGTISEISLSVRNYQRRDDWQTIREFGGGQVLNWGPHIIDQALMLLDGEVREQYGDLKHSVAGGDCEDHFSLHFIGENKRKVNVWISGACVLGGGRNVTAYGNRGAISCDNYHVHMKYINPEQVLPPVMSNPGTPPDSFGAAGTFKAENEPQWIEKEFDIEDEDLTVIWDYLYESYRNGAEFPIKDAQVLRMMQAISRLFEENELDDFTAMRDRLNQ